MSLNFTKVLKALNFSLSTIQSAMESYYDAIDVVNSFVYSLI